MLRVSPASEMICRGHPRSCEEFVLSGPKYSEYPWGAINNVLQFDREYIDGTTGCLVTRDPWLRDWRCLDPAQPKPCDVQPVLWGQAEPFAQYLQEVTQFCCT